ncbi:MAG: saccharopine dehydrogenase [Thermoplasmata archaeon]|nr:MAG: saccharopine dehydrogenase [Thermoplasmata archaeon]
MGALILGGGMMGLAIAYDLIKNNVAVTIADINENCLENMPYVKKHVDFFPVDAKDNYSIKKVMRKNDIAISALPYDFNYQLAKNAIKCKTHFCDLGGNIEMVEKELSLHEKAKKADVLVIPDCGLAPGITNVICSYLIKKIHGIKEIHIRVGGLPQKPEGPLNYALFFSVHGLINEYVEKARIVKGGDVVEVESLTGIEEISFSSFPELEAFYTSGGTSTLPKTFKGKIEELDYKTIRYKGHCEKMKLLKDLGFFNENARADTEKNLERALKKNVPDVVLARVTGIGKEKIKMEFIDYFDSNENITAMMRTTGFSTSIIAQMILDGIIIEKGALPPEKCVPPNAFFEELKKRNIKIREGS